MLQTVPMPMPFDPPSGRNDSCAALARVGSEGQGLHVAILTGGGDAPGLNATMRAFFHSATRRAIRVSASCFGFEGLLGSEGVLPIGIDDVHGILPRGGSILGCSTKSNPFAVARDPAGRREVASAVRSSLVRHGVDALVLAGGDGTMDIARTLHEFGIRCIGIPKTIDGDLGGTEQTCGIDSAVETPSPELEDPRSSALAVRAIPLETIIGKRGVSIALGAIVGRWGRESASPRSA